MSGLHLNTGGRASDVRAFAEEVEAIGASLSDVPLQAAGRYYHVWLGILSGDYRGTERLCRTLIDALPGDLSRERLGLVAYPAVVARAFLARALAELGMFEEGREHGQEAVRLAETLDHPFSLIWACLNLGHLEEPPRRIHSGDHTARTRSRSLPRVEHRVPDSNRPGGSGARLCAVRASGGRRLLAAASAGGLWVCWDRISTFDEQVQFGEAHLLAGQVEQAWDFATRALALARERGERGHEAWAHLLLGKTASHRDGPDVAGAEAHYATSKALASELGMRPLVAHCHFSLGKL